MLIRISLIIAIVAGLAVGGLNFVKVKEKITTLITERDTEKSQKETAQRELASTKKELQSTKADLASTKQTLETTTAEKDKAVADASRATQRATQLTEELAKTRTDLGDAQAEVARFRASGLSPEQVVTLAKDLRDTQATLAGAQDENKVLGQRIRKLDNELAFYRDPDKFTVPLPATAHGKVLISDPKWDFVVLDIGENQGVLERGELLVSRNGNFVAKVRIQSVQKDRSIANIIPGPWKVGEVMEGDQVIPARPAS
jgi:hypothetical protein